MALAEIMKLKDVIRANQVAQDVWDDCASRFMGINRTDARCIDIIDRHEKITAGVLASESGLTTGAVTVVVDRLEAAGYVARMRDLDDRRKVWIACTPITTEISSRMFAHFRLLTPLFMARYTPDQLAAIVEFLEVGSRVNLEQAAILEQHVDRKGTTPEALLVAARQFERNAARHMAAMIAGLQRGMTEGE